MKRTRRPLTKEEIEGFKNKLLELKEEIWKKIAKDLKERVKEEYQSILNDIHDEEELAQIDLQEETILGVLDTRKKELEAITQALWRIEKGEYGRCLNCGDWICLERLKVRPQALYCLPCKDELERIQSV